MAEGRGGASALWARNDLRHRWRALVVLGVLAGITAGFAMAALAGARRTDTALARLRATTNAADAVVFPGQVGRKSNDWGPLRDRPEVAQVGVWDLLFGEQDGVPGSLLFGADDDQWLGQLNRPVVEHGRMPDAAASDEVVVDEAAAKTLPIGSTFSFRPYGIDQNDESGEPATGPLVTMKVVGVVRTLNQFLFVADGQVLVGPGFVARYRSEILTIENADVRLRGGAADIAALQRDVNDVLAPGTPVLDLHDLSRRVDTTLAVERTALLLLAAVVAIAGGLLVAQALVRSAGIVGDDALVLRAIGMTRSQLVGATVLSHALTTAVAVVVGLAAAIVGSQWLPVGLGRRIDPDVGIHGDLTVLVPGATLTATLVLVGASIVAWRSSHILSATRSTRASSLVAAIRRRAPVSIGIGAAMAFERRRGRQSVPVGPALLGAVVGVLGVVGTFTIDRGINDSLDHPERAGVTWHATAYPQPDAYVPSGLVHDTVQRIVSAAPAGTAASIVDREVIGVGGVGVQTFAIRDSGLGTQNVALTVTSGRAPASDGEAAIGPATARVLHLGVGDSLHIGDAALDVRIVGIALFPDDVHTSFDEGLWVVPTQLDAASPPPSDVDSFTGDRYVALRFPSGTNVKATINAMSAALGEVAFLSPASVPLELTNLQHVRTLPLVLAGFLALLAIAAVSHVLVTSSRRRRHDFAILRAIGLSRRGSRMVLYAQGTAIGLVGLLVGLPLGVAAGRAGWHYVADRVPLEDVPPFAAVAILLVVPVTVLVVNVLAVWPGRRVARLHPAELLRAE